MKNFAIAIAILAISLILGALQIAPTPFTAVLETLPLPGKLAFCLGIVAGIVGVIMIFIDIANLEDVAAEAVTRHNALLDSFKKTLLSKGYKKMPMHSVGSGSHGIIFSCKGAQSGVKEYYPKVGWRTPHIPGVQDSVVIKWKGDCYIAPEFNDRSQVDIDHNTNSGDDSSQNRH